MTSVLVEERTQTRLGLYARNLSYEALPPQVAWKAKAHIVDTLGAVVAGYASGPAGIARQSALRAPATTGATVIGSRIMATPDAAAFANAVAARGVDTLDAYHKHGKVGHPADTIAPLLTVAEHVRASGSELIVATVVAYELFCWLRDDFAHKGFDNTTCARIAAAAGAARLMRLDADAIAQCLALCAVTDNALKEVRSRPAVMTRSSAAGYQARGAVFAAMLAAAGAGGPRSAFDGRAGWFGLVAAGSYDPAGLGGAGAPFRILDTWLKLRAIPGAAYPLVLVAEKLAPLRDPASVRHIRLDVYGKLKKGFGDGEKRWNPDSADTADHSAPYVVSTILAKGALTLRSFDETQIWHEPTRALMRKVEVFEDEAYSAAYQARREHRARLTISRTDGTMQVAETGGDEDDFSAPRSEGQLNDKFRMLADPALGRDRVDGILSQWWKLESVPDVSKLIPELTQEP